MFVHIFAKTRSLRIILTCYVAFMACELRKWTENYFQNGNVVELSQFYLNITSRQLKNVFYYEPGHPF